MKHLNLANRYARALYSLAKDKHEQDKVFAEMRVVATAIESAPEVGQFFSSPLIRPTEKVAMLEKALTTIDVREVLKDFLFLLAKKGRLGIFKEVVTAYQRLEDEANGVTRGHVRSAGVLDPDERKRIETIVSRATGKQVILTYKEDATLLGGLVAEVGSLTFDDSLTSHLKRINEQLTRSAH